MAKCAEPLQKAVDTQTSQGRPTVRQHGFHLWSSVWSPIAPQQATPAQGRNDAREQRTSLYGTTGCWSKFADGSAACSGVYPIWLTWPNTGKPYGSGPTACPVSASAVATSPTAASSASSKPTPGATSSSPAPRARAGETLRSKRRAYNAPLVKGNPDPTQQMTVNTDAPKYALPPLALAKQCGITAPQAARLLAEKKYDEITAACTKAGAPDLFCKPAPTNQPAVSDGTVFVNQGDVMIATESLSAEGYEEIQKNELYDQSVLAQMYQAQNNTIPELLSRRFTQA